jgi:cation diffusion facilitator family transporter
LIRYLIRRYVKDYQDVANKDVRESYGVLAGALGLICNVSLFALKLTIGLLTNSIAVTSDAFNNLSDNGSSLVAIIGAKMSNRPPDKEHPHGHGRIEYIAALVVSFIIFAAGLVLLKSSIDKLLNREPIQFSVVSTAILAASILVKVFMFSYNRYIGVAINSGIQRATASDSLNDVIATSAVVIGTILGQYTSFPIDGALGLVISCLVMYTGFSTAKESIDSLLGSCPDPEIADRINSIVLEGRNIEGAHDLEIHDYGPGRTVGSIHAEVSDDASIVDIHAEIDQIERRIETELGIVIVIHMDPEGSSAAEADRAAR